MTDQPSTPVRAEILDTGDERIASAQIVIDAPPEVIFDILVQPRRHSEIDGSKSVQGIIKGPERLALGDTFKVRMKIRVNYWVTNTVLEFEQNRRITWAHLLGNRWTYELTSLEPGKTLVRETNNMRAAGWRASLSPVSRNPQLCQRSIAKSLVRLKQLAESEA
ncbi:MAG: SRPBCC family protein [Actinomycetales bacterium]